VVVCLFVMTAAPLSAQCTITPGGCGIYPVTPVYDPYCLGNPQIGSSFGIVPGGPNWWWASVSNFHLFGLCPVSPWPVPLPNSLSCTGAAVSCTVGVYPIILLGPVSPSTPNLYFQIPNDPLLLGVTFCYQTVSFVDDPGSTPPTCWELTRTLRITID